MDELIKMVAEVRDAYMGQAKDIKGSHASVSHALGPGGTLKLGVTMTQTAALIAMAWGVVECARALRHIANSLDTPRITMSGDEQARL